MFLENLDPIAFSVGPLQVRWYGIAMAFAVALGIGYLLKRGKALGLDEDTLLTLSLWSVIAGVVGARLLFVITNFPHWFWTDPLQVLKVYEGGLAWHGGLFGGMLAGWLFLRNRSQLNFNVLADFTVPGLAIGYALIRQANIVNHEILGNVTELGFVWPAQLIGSAIGLVLLVRYFYLVRFPLPAGYQFWSFVLYHQLFRGLVEESVREMPLAINLYVSQSWGMGFLTAAQIATVPIILFAWLMLRRLKTSKVTEHV